MESVSSPTAVGASEMQEDAEWEASKQTIPMGGGRRQPAMSGRLEQGHREGGKRRHAPVPTSCNRGLAMRRDYMNMC